LINLIRNKILLKLKKLLNKVRPIVNNKVVAVAPKINKKVKKKIINIKNYMMVKLNNNF